MPLLQLSDISVAYGHVPLLDHTDLVIVASVPQEPAFEPGQTVFEAVAEGVGTHKAVQSIRSNIAFRRAPRRGFSVIT